MEVYTEKTKDQTVYKILNFYHRFSERDIAFFYYGLVIIPMITIFLASFIITTKIILVIFGVMLFSIVAMLYSLLVLVDILNKDTGNERMMEIADAIREGSEGFFSTQYTTIFKLSLLFGIVIFLFYLGRTITPDDIIKELIGTYMISIFIVFSFFMGALCSAISGYTGMWVSVRTNIR
jgi:Na+/H+-translocating membrane pyrophosphatase